MLPVESSWTATCSSAPLQNHHKAWHNTQSFQEGSQMYINMDRSNQDEGARAKAVEKHVLHHLSSDLPQRDAIHPFLHITHQETEIWIEPFLYSQELNLGLLITALPSLASNPAKTLTPSTVLKSYRTRMWLTDFISLEMITSMLKHYLTWFMSVHLQKTALMTFWIPSNQTLIPKKCFHKLLWQESKKTSAHTQCNVALLLWTGLCFLSHNTQPTVQFYKVPEECISCYPKHITSRAHEWRFVSSFYNKLRGLSSLMAY